METLVLDATYQVINRVSWRRAFEYLLKEKVEVLYEHSEMVVHSASATHKVPSIVRFPNTIVPWKRRRVKYSRDGIYARDRGVCQYCGKRTQKSSFELEHVIPKSQGGRTCWENIVVSCPSCNRKKDNRTPEQAGMRLLRKPIAPTPSELGRSRIESGEFPEEWREFLG